MRRLTIAGFVAALTLGSFVVVASAQDRPLPPPKCGPAYTPPPGNVPVSACWPTLKGDPVVPVTKDGFEWYSDLPWRQKLGTYNGNELDEALVLPYGALVALGRSCGSYTPERCMIETGINNILGVLRTDTPYDKTDSLITGATYCNSNVHPKSQPCIEVKLALSMFWTQNSNTLQKRAFGDDTHGNPYGGYVITDGQTYGPVMP
jgi:hypothetical protein